MALSHAIQKYFNPATYTILLQVFPVTTLPTPLGHNSTAIVEEEEITCNVKYALKM